MNTMRLQYVVMVVVMLVVNNVQALQLSDSVYKLAAAQAVTVMNAQAPSSTVARTQALMTSTPVRRPLSIKRVYAQHPMLAHAYKTMAS